jgi:N-methylhydantoinase A
LVEQKILLKPLGKGIERAAYGAHLIATSNMIRAIKAVSTERGRDPREFALFAFGGNGPLFATGVAAALGITRIVVPPSAGLFSSFGLLYADVEHHYARTFRRLLRKADRIDGCASRPGSSTSSALSTMAKGRYRSDGPTQPR